MPFIGQQPITGAYSKLDSITTSATATYNLQLNGGAYYPQSANHLLVSLNGVMQAPQDSFTVSGSQITFASALTSSDNIDFIMALGDVLDIGTPSDGSVNTSQLANSAVTDAKMASTLDLSGKTVTYGLTSLDMPVGSIIQVTQGTTTTQVEHSNSATGVDIDLGFTVSITPNATSSKILINLANYSVLTRDAATIAKLWLDRRIDGGSWTRICGIANYLGQNAHYEAYPNAMHLDTPNTTDQVDYRLIGWRFAGTANIAFHHDNNDTPDLISTLTCMELRQ